MGNEENKNLNNEEEKKQENEEIVPETEEETEQDDFNESDFDDENEDDFGPEPENDESEDSESELQEDISNTVNEPQTAEPAEKKEPGKPIDKKKLFKVLGIVCGAVALIYFGGVLFYSGHFMWGTEIGGFNCSNMSVESAEKNIKQEIDNYTFTFYEKDGVEESITGKEIHLASAPIENMAELKARQNPFIWFMPNNEHILPATVEVTFNEDALYNRITEMKFMETSRNRAKDGAGKIKYYEGQYVVTDYGEMNVVGLLDVYNKVKPKIKELYKGMSLEKENCYTGLGGEDTVRGAVALLNKYVSSSITYKTGDKTKVINKDIINEWLGVGEDYSINIDYDKVRAYVDEMSKEYDTVGKDRTFHTTGGDTITVSGGSYGWVMDNQQETEALIDNIRSGETVEKEPIYKQKAAAHNESDIAGTYVEVSIGAQHVWYYKDGNLEVSTDCVTGNTSLGRGTHTGTYYVLYKDKNVILRGDNYASPVTFWMPFNGGEGLHDATWRGAFGGSIYQGAGSHGCVNLPYSAAQSLYSVISPGDPVIVY